MKATRIGWVGKNAKLEVVRPCKGDFELDHVYIEPIVYGSRGTRRDWGYNDWPPVKVRITIETV
jgi:hypothetical protein